MEHLQLLDIDGFSARKPFESKRSQLDPVYAATPKFTTIPRTSYQPHCQQILGCRRLPPAMIRPIRRASPDRESTEDPNSSDDKSTDDQQNKNDDDDHQSSSSSSTSSSSSSSSSSDDNQNDNDDDNDQGVVDQIFSRDKRDSS